MRKLAGLYGVSVPTVRAAIHALDVLGFVRTAHGVGVFVTSPKDHTAVLNYVWRNASISELAIIRATIDERTAPILAAQVSALPDIRLPRNLAEVNFLVHERSMHRIGDPRSFLKADFAFHRSLLDAVRGVEIGPELYRHVADRMIESLMPVADAQAANADLDSDHLQLAAAVLGGEVPRTRRLARRIARVELRSLGLTLG